MDAIRFATLLEIARTLRGELEVDVLTDEGTSDDVRQGRVRVRAIGKCDLYADALAERLRDAGFAASVARGVFVEDAAHARPHLPRRFRHFWVVVSDARGYLIADVTADQFSERFPPVLIGTAKEWPQYEAAGRPEHACAFEKARQS